LEGKTNIFILYFIVAILALTLAVLSGYIFINGNNQKAPVANEKTTIRIPKEDELEIIPVFKEKKAFNLKNSGNDKTMHVAMLNMQMQYYKKVNGIKDAKKKVETNLAAINEIVIVYFQKMTYEEAIDPNMKDKFKSELKESINKFLISNEEKAKGEIIYTVIFDEWFCQ
jgi:flagellar basal body-associated protein FliL